MACQSAFIRPERTSRQDRLDDLTMHIGKPVIPPAVPKRQFSMIDTELVQQGGVEVVNGQGMDDRGVAELVALAVGRTALETAARQSVNPFT